MKITRKNGPGTKVSLTIVPVKEELEPLKKHVLNHFRETVKIPGFREGTAPYAMVEKHADQQTLQTEFIQHAINHFYPRALEAEKIRAVGQPEIKITKFVPFAELEFEAELDALGPIIIPDYKKIKVQKKPVAIAPKDIDDVLTTLKQRLADRKAVERGAKAGDEVLIDFDGYDKEGKAVPGASAKRHAITIGSQSFIPGFEDNLVGLKTGDSKEFRVKFPPDYATGGLANQSVDFKVTVHQVNELAEPKLDSEFAAKAGPFKSIAELKADIKKQLAADKEAQAAREYENEVVQRITERSKLEVPKSLIEEELVRMEEEEKRDLVFRGQTWLEHLKQEGITEEQHRERQRPIAEQRVRGGLVLSEIAEKEKIQASSEEVDQRIELLKSQYTDEQMRAELDKPENRNNIVSRLLTEKTVAKLIGYASKN